MNFKDAFFKLVYRRSYFVVVGVGWCATVLSKHVLQITLSTVKLK
jgi:hypothetical protein